MFQQCYSLFIVSEIFRVSCDLSNFGGESFLEVRHSTTESSPSRLSAHAPEQSGTTAKPPRRAMNPGTQDVWPDDTQSRKASGCE